MSKIFGYSFIFVGIVLTLIWARVISYLVQQILNPFSLKQGLSEGIPRQINQFELLFDNIVFLAPLLLATGIWLAKPFLKPLETAPTSPKSYLSAPTLYFVVFSILFLFSLRLLLLLLGGTYIQTEYDEGVHLMATRLLIDGHIPYRDYLHSSPPSHL
jgi:hypothetical protein